VFVFFYEGHFISYQSVKWKLYSESSYLHFLNVHFAVIYTFFQSHYLFYHLKLFLFPKIISQLIHPSGQIFFSPITYFHEFLTCLVSIILAFDVIPFRLGIIVVVVIITTTGIPHLALLIGSRKTEH
jgi:hypothetical protein